MMPLQQQRWAGYAIPIPHQAFQPAVPVPQLVPDGLDSLCSSTTHASRLAPPGASPQPPRPIHPKSLLGVKSGPETATRTPSAANGHCQMMPNAHEISVLHPARGSRTDRFASLASATGCRCCGERRRGKEAQADTASGLNNFEARHFSRAFFHIVGPQTLCAE